MNPIDHELLSERLQAFLDGTLAPAEAAAVESHLDDCALCRQEAAGLRALAAIPGVELEHPERARLLASVMRAIEEPEEIGDAGPVARLRAQRVAFVESRTSWMARFAGVGAAAAVLVIVALFFTMGGGDDLSGGDSDSAEVSEVTRGQDRDQEGAKKDSKRSAAGTTGTTEALSAPAGSAAEDSGSGGAGKFAAPRPTFNAGRRRLTDAGLRRLGSRSLGLVLFSRAYKAEDVDDRLKDDFVAELAASAQAQAGPSASDQVTTCARAVLRREEAILPAFGSYAVYDGRRVLVIGFAWTDGTIGALDRSMLWTWPRGSCRSRLDYRTGTIKPEQ